MKLMRAGQVVTRLTRTLAALLASPRSTGEWSEHSVEALRKLVRARQAAMLLASEGEQRVFGDQGAGALLRQLPSARTPGVLDADRALGSGLARGLAAASLESAPEPTSVAIQASDPNRVEAVGVVSSLDDRQAVVGIYCTFAHPVSDRVARSRLALLNVVRPALEAAARERLSRRRELDGVRRTLHAFDTGAALYTADGLLVDANNAAVGLLAGEDGDGPVHRGMARAAVAAPRADGAREPIEVCTPAGRFRMRASPIGSLSTGLMTDVLVVVEPVAARTESPALTPDIELLRERFRLTEREQEVARLLCLGQSNVAIAEALGISPNTARHHTERVLMKLDIRSRAAIHRVVLELQRDAGRTPALADRRETPRPVTLPRGAGYRSGLDVTPPRGNGSLPPRAD